jgi:hypothetical protein
MEYRLHLHFLIKIITIITKVIVSEIIVVAIKNFRISFALSIIIIFIITTTIIIIIIIEFI